MITTLLVIAGLILVGLSFALGYLSGLDTGLHEAVGKLEQSSPEFPR